MYIKTESGLCWGAGGRILTTDLLMAYNCVREDKSSDWSGWARREERLPEMRMQLWVLSHQCSKLCFKGLSQHIYNLWFNHIFTLLFETLSWEKVICKLNAWPKIYVKYLHIQYIYTCAYTHMPSSTKDNNSFWLIRYSNQELISMACMSSSIFKELESNKRDLTSKLSGT